MIYLKQSTASQEVLLGPFVDSTDGNTAETGLTIANTDIKLWVAGATTLASKNSGGGTHISNGNYYAVLDATDTATLGSGAIVVQVSGALAVRHDFTVLSANIYDSLIGGTDLFDVSVTQIAGAAVSTSTAQLGVNVVNFGGSAGTFASGIPAVNTTQMSGDSTAADNIETAFDDTAGPVPWMGIVDQGTAQSASATTVVLRSAAAFGDDTIIGATIGVFGSTQGYWQFALITAYVGSTDTATVPTWAVTPSGTITYKIFGTAAGTGAAAPTAAEVADAVWDEATSGHTTSGTFGEQCKTDIDAILVDTGTTLDGRIPAALVSGRMDASVGAMAANTLTASALATDAVTEIQSGLATPTNITAGTITTVTNLTNAPTAGDLTATMKTSVATAAGAAANYQKNVAANDIPFVLVDSTDHVTRKTGITVTATRSIDGGAFGPATGTVSEVANGVYVIDASQADMNGNNIVFRFTGTACDPVELHIKTFT